MSAEQPPPAPFNPVIVSPDGRPARLPRNANCPQCGAGADRRVRSGMGAIQDVTCENCGHEFDKERVVI